MAISLSSKNAASFSTGSFGPFDRSTRLINNPCVAGCPCRAARNFRDPHQSSRRHGPYLMIHGRGHIKGVFTNSRAMRRRVAQLNRRTGPPVGALRQREEYKLVRARRQVERHALVRGTPAPGVPTIVTSSSAASRSRGGSAGPGSNAQRPQSPPPARAALECRYRRRAGLDRAFSARHDIQHTRSGRRPELLGAARSRPLVGVF